MNKIYYVGYKDGSLAFSGFDKMPGNNFDEIKVYAGYEQAVRENEDLQNIVARKENTRIVKANIRPSTEDVYIEKRKEADDIIAGATPDINAHPFIMEQCALTGESPAIVAAEVVVESNLQRKDRAKKDAERIIKKRQGMSLLS